MKIAIRERTILKIMKMYQTPKKTKSNKLKILPKLQTTMKKTSLVWKKMTQKNKKRKKRKKET